MGASEIDEHVAVGEHGIDVAADGYARFQAGSMAGIQTQSF